MSHFASNFSLLDLGYDIKTMESFCRSCMNDAFFSRFHAQKGFRSEVNFSLRILFLISERLKQQFDER